MMPQQIDKGKIYLYFILLFILLSVHNVNSTNSISNYFKIKKIEITSNTNENLNNKILLSLNSFYNSNIFALKSNDIKVFLDKFNIISEYKVKKIYPSIIKIELKETNILAYFFDNNEKIFIGENGKKIKEIKFSKDNLPLIVGKVKIENFLTLRKYIIDNGFNFNDFNTFYFYKSYRWDLVYKNKLTIKLPTDNPGYSINLLKKIIDTKNIKDLKIIDLRIKNRIILS